MSKEISVKEAYLAMYSFLDELYSKYGYEQLGGLLGGMSLLPDGSTADEAIWHDWLRCIEKAKAGQIDAELRLNRHDGANPNRP
ncbi:MAG: hypothetical protein KF777_11885 [Planctomycetaceae bacterium]|nr:hypothetical protein [Planctomycetaceae bacterium]